MKTPVDKHGLAVDVATRIRAAILSGELQIGSRINEIELASSLQVSRGPIRDAIVILKQEGLLDGKWHKGAFVRTLSKKDAEEIYSLRSVIERLAVERVVKLGTAQDLRDIESKVRGIEAAASNGSQAEMLEADIAFHESLYCAAHHDRLLHAWFGMRSQIALLLLNRQGVDSNYRRELSQEHWAIFNAISDRDGARSTELISRHINEAGARVLSRLTAHMAG